MTCQQLDYELGLKCTEKIVKKAMGSINYHKCIAYKKDKVNKKTVRDKNIWVELMKAQYPRLED